MVDRIAPEIFSLPIHEIRRGYYSAVYFGRAVRVVTKVVPNRTVLMQFFAREYGTVCGIDECLAVIRQCSGHYRDPEAAFKIFDEYLRIRQAIDRGGITESNALQLLSLSNLLEEEWIDGWNDLEVRALLDGARMVPWVPVLTIQGHYRDFGILESVLLGILARRSAVATAVTKVVFAAKPKPILFFADRFDHWSNQTGDGYAAYIGGGSAVASDAMGHWWGEPGVGTMPHALIAAFDGQTASAAVAFHETFPDVDLVALVDFNNDCVADALDCLDALGGDLKGVRLDTSSALIDASIVRDIANRTAGEWHGRIAPLGVSPVLVQKVRDALDVHGGKHVKITVSGGFNAERIRLFEEMYVPTDSYGVGSSLLREKIDFTADIVQPAAKVGRQMVLNPALSVVPKDY